MVAPRPVPWEGQANPIDNHFGMSIGARRWVGWVVGMPFRRGEAASYKYYWQPGITEPGSRTRATATATVRAVTAHLIALLCIDNPPCTWESQRDHTAPSQGTPPQDPRTKPHGGASGTLLGTRWRRPTVAGAEHRAWPSPHTRWLPSEGSSPTTPAR